jgi:hypothetical protein
MEYRPESGKLYNIILIYFYIDRVIKPVRLET